MAGTSVDLTFRPGDPAFQILTLFLEPAQHSVPDLARLTGLAPTATARWADVLARLRLLDVDPTGTATDPAVRCGSTRRTRVTAALSDQIY